MGGSTKMADSAQHDAWSAGASYEFYMGRWSREIARRFVGWLAEPSDLDWVDVGCGTGALSAIILGHCSPRSVLGVDPAEGFVEHARATVDDPRARFEVAGADALPCADASAQVVTSALAYNFFPDRPLALAEMRRAAEPGGTVALYVWDYPGGGMGFISAFWEAATALDAKAEALAEDRRFPFCTRDALLEEAEAAGLGDAVVEGIEISSRFEDFEAFWHPFTLGAGPAPGYCSSLTEDERLALKRRLEDDLCGNKGPIELPARAWAIRGKAR